MQCVSQSVGRHGTVVAGRRAKVSLVQITGTRDFPQPRAAVFRAIVDPELVADALPGVGRVDVRDPDHWSAQIAIPFVARAPTLRFEFSVVEREEPERARIHAVGKTLGASLRVEVAIRLDDREGGTTVAYAAAPIPGGLLARMPEALVQKAADGALARLLDAAERSAARYATR